MSFDFSTLVTDRTQADVSRVKQIAEKIKNGTASESELAEFNSASMKGAYNYTDLNRVTAAMESLKAKLNGYGYDVPGYQRVKVPHVLPEPEPTSRLPEGYTELTYIESTGTQYVDTSFKPNQNTRIVADIELISPPSNYPVPFGVQSSSSTQFWVYVNSASAVTANWQALFGSKETGSSATGSGRQTIDFSQSGFSADAVTVAIPAQIFQCNHSLWLCGHNSSGSARFLTKAKYYSCQIYDNGTLARDYIPCINPDGAVGLYDLVTAAFFGNSGTGSFVAGPLTELPKGYTRVEYIQSSGTQYIDTGFKPNNNTGIEIKFNIPSGFSDKTELFGARNSSTYFELLFYTAGSMYLQFGSQLPNKSFVPGDFDLKLDGGKLYDKTNGSLLLDASAAGTFQINQTLYLFAMHNASGGVERQIKAKLYSCQIYDNGTLVRDFVPCKNASGVLGLFDLVNDVFYQNAGTGAFAAGDEVAAPAAAAVAVVSGNAAEYDPYTWYEFDWPTPESMTIYLLNVSAIRSVLAVLRSTPEVPTDMERLMTRDANDIEAILLDVYRQLAIMPTTFIPCGEALCGGDNL